MKILMIAACMLTAPACAFAQSASADGSSPHSKINVAVRADMVEPEVATPHQVGTMKARSARVGEHTVTLIDGNLPTPNTTVATADQVSAGT